jgi:hypothetical protein
MMLRPKSLLISSYFAIDRSNFVKDGSGCVRSLLVLKRSSESAHWLICISTGFLESLYGIAGDRFRQFQLIYNFLGRNSFAIQ